MTNRLTPISDGRKVATTAYIAASVAASLGFIPVGQVNDNLRLHKPTYISKTRLSNITEYGHEYSNMNELRPQDPSIKAMQSYTAYATLGDILFRNAHDFSSNGIKALKLYREKKYKRI